MDINVTLSLARKSCPKPFVIHASSIRANNVPFLTVAALPEAAVEMGRQSWLLPATGHLRAQPQSASWLGRPYLSVLFRLPNKLLHFVFCSWLNWSPKVFENAVQMPAISHSKCAEQEWERESLSFVQKQSPYVLCFIAACKRKEQEHGKDRGNTPKKPRLVFTDVQRRTLHAIFKENKRPSKELQITISQQLGLELSTVSNFFMNARRRSLDKWQDEGSSSSGNSSSSSSSSTCTKA